MFDEIDLKILALLQDNARTANAEIARQIDMAPSAVAERIRKLEERGAIKGYKAQLDPHALGLGLTAFIFVRSREGNTYLDTERELLAIPEVEEIHNVAGEDCYLVKVRAADTQAFGQLLREKFAPLPSVLSTRTTIVLETIKEDGALPLRIQGA